MGMISTKSMEALEKRLQFLKAVEGVLKQAEPEISEMAYKINTDAGKESVEIKFRNGLIRRADVTNKTYNQMLTEIIRRIK